MKCAIMQPTYLPWSGYFKMISDVDVFIFLDDVQFAKRSWQQRNKIILNGQEKFLTVPVLSSGKRFQKINEVKTLDESEWKTSHLQIMRQAYGKHLYFEELNKLLNNAFQATGDNLCNINIKIISEIATYLGIKTNFIKSSHLEANGSKSEYLLNICKEVGADTYLSAPGSKQYIEDEQLFLNSPIKLEYSKFNPKEYIQKNQPSFISHLSIIDVIANLGRMGTVNYIGGD